MTRSVTAKHHISFARTSQETIPSDHLPLGESIRMITSAHLVRDHQPHTGFYFRNNRVSPRIITINIQIGCHSLWGNLSRQIYLSVNSSFVRGWPVIFSVGSDPLRCNLFTRKSCRLCRIIYGLPQRYPALILLLSDLRVMNGLIVGIFNLNGV